MIGRKTPLQHQSQYHTFTISFHRAILSLLLIPFFCLWVACDYVASVKYHQNKQKGNNEMKENALASKFQWWAQQNCLPTLKERLVYSMFEWNPCFH